MHALSSSSYFPTVAEKGVHSGLGKRRLRRAGYPARIGNPLSLSWREKQREQMVKDHSLVIHHLHTSLQMPLAIHHHQFIFIQERPKASANVCYPDYTVWLTRGFSQLSVLRAYHGWPDAHLLDLSTINVNTTWRSGLFYSPIISLST